MFSLSVCMIVKNEEDVLERVLKCAKQFADEIVIVDTGSTDKTVEIAKQFTDKVFFYKWNNNFSDARNYSFSKATKDYVMWLDADDYVTKESISLINDLKLIKTNTDVFMLLYSMGFNKENKPTLQFYRERILKRSCNFKWEGFIHEVITPSGKVEYKTIEIQHRKEKVKDHKRNLKLYQDAIKRGVEFNARERYYFARELYYHRYYSSCIKQLNAYLKMQRLYEADIRGAYLILAECYLQLNKPTIALKKFSKYINQYEPTSEVCCMMGAIYNALKNYNLAKFWFKSATICDATVKGFVHPEFNDIIPYLELTKIYYLLGDINKSYYYHQRCVQIQPENTSVKHNICFFKQYFENKK